MHTVSIGNVFKQLSADRIAEMIFDGFDIVHCHNCSECKKG